MSCIGQWFFLLETEYVNLLWQVTNYWPRPEAKPEVWPDDIYELRLIKHSVYREIDNPFVIMECWSKQLHKVLEDSRIRIIKTREELDRDLDDVFQLPVELTEESLIEEILSIFRPLSAKTGDRWNSEKMPEPTV